MELIGQKVTSVSEYIEVLIDILKNNKKNFIEMAAFYRGNTSNRPLHDIYPKVYRDHIYYEDTIINETITHKFDYFCNCRTAIEKLEMLQHYGIPTRLLDITQNQLVALYFACQKSSKKAEDDGKVIIYMLERKYIKYNDSDTVSVLANIAFMPRGFRIDINKTEREIKDSANYLKLLDQIRKEKVSFRADIRKELFDDYVVCVIPNMNNKRIIAQQGAFLLYGIKDGRKMLCSEMSLKYNKQFKIKEIIIDKKSKKKILKELQVLGISDEVLFPELESYSKHIENEYRITYDASIELANRLLVKRQEEADDDLLVLECPDCGEKFLVKEGSSTAECIYCNYIANNTEVADAYAEGNLGISKYEYAKDGMNWPIYECPECGEESFVLQSIDSEGYCTSCEYKSIPYEYQFCDECYKLIKDSEAGICYSCLQDKINKDRY